MAGRWPSSFLEFLWTNKQILLVSTQESVRTRVEEYGHYTRCEGFT